MRTWIHRRSVRTLTAVLAAGLAVSGGATAHADLVVNGVDDTMDTTVERMPLDLKTGPGSTTIYVVPADGDDDPGCNFDGASETVTVNLVSSNVEVATVTPSSLVLAACGTTGAKTVTVTPVGEGSATVTTTVATGTNKTGGSFSIANARFSVHVTAVPNTPPVLDVVGVEEGGEYAKGTLQRPSCVATDPDDVPTAPHQKTWLAPLTEITGPYAVDGIGMRRAMCSYVDGTGVQVLTNKRYAIVDESAPVIQRVLDPGLPTSGWYREDVTLTHTVFENQSPSSFQAPTGCETVTVDDDTRLKQVVCSATSSGGTNTVTTNIRRDATAPAVSPTSTVVSGTLGADGWYTSPVGVSFTATDMISSFLTAAGTVSTTSTRTATSEGEGAAVVVGSPAFADRAGNESPVGTVPSAALKIDLTPPTVDLSADFDSSYFFGAVPVAPTCTASDAVSGLAADCTVDGYGTAVGTHTVTAKVTDRAGHTSTATDTYTVKPWTTHGFAHPVDMGTTTNSVKGGNTVPVKFELFAGDTELTAVENASFTAVKTACQSGVVLDDVEVLGSGSTSLRYDAVAGNYHYNWKTPTGPACYSLTMQAKDGTTSAVAKFRTK